jgi:hypothetical protein
MSTEEWWTAERKAAEFWRKVRENQMVWRDRNVPNHERGPTPPARSGDFGTAILRQLARI